MKKILLTLAIVLFAPGFFWSQCVPSCSVYVVAPTTFTTMSVAGHNTVTSFSNPDDAMSGTLPIGFNFTFYCNVYTSFQASTNGFITFDLASTANGCCSGQPIPNGGAPNNFVALRWTDLHNYTTGKVTYTTVGTAPNRRCIITYTDVAIYSNPSILNAGHIILFETTNEIEIHSVNLPSYSSNQTQGIENINGTLGVWTPGANGVPFSLSNTGYRFFAGGTPTPISAIGGSSINICQGTVNNYTATPMPGATSYNWSFPSGWNGSGATSVVTTTAGASGSISVTATYSCGTSTAIAISVTTIPAPHISALTASPMLLCSGQTVTITGVSSTATNYTLLPTGTSGNPPFFVTPGTSTSYSLVAENAAGCRSFASPIVNVTVKETPTITISSGSVCVGQPFSLNPTGATNYTLSSIFSIVTPQTAGVHTYTAIGTNSTGCVSNAVIATVMANPVPATTAGTNRASICQKESAVITAGGATTYLWSSGSTSSTVEVTPNAPIVYTVLGTTGGCSKSASVTVMVSPCTGIENNVSAAGSMLIYPNPSNGEFTLNAPFPVSAIVYDMLGRVVFEKQLNEGTHKINLGQFPAGNYLLKTTTDNSKQTTVLIKQ